MFHLILSERRIILLRFVCWSSLLLSPVIAGAQTASNRKLADEIQSLLKAEGPIVAERTQAIFLEYGLPTDAMVGSEAADTYAVIAADGALPLLEHLMPAYRKAARAGHVAKSTARFIEVRLRQRQVQESFRNPENEQLRAKIESLYQTDQANRQAENMNPQMWADLDRKNGLEERAIFAKYGVPSYGMVGAKAADEFVTLVLHQPLAFMREVLPKLRKNVDAGQADPSSYAMLLDRVRTEEKRPQMYGTRFVCSDGSLVPAPLTDPKTLDARRAEIGLVPMDVYVRLMRAMYPKDYCNRSAMTDPGRP